MRGVGLVKSHPYADNRCGRAGHCPYIPVARHIAHFHGAGFPCNGEARGRQSARAAA